MLVRLFSPERLQSYQRLSLARQLSHCIFSKLPTQHDRLCRFLCILLGDYDGVKAFSYISNTLVAFILASFSALLIYAVYHNHRQLMMPWLFATILIACTRDIYMLIRSFFFASTGTWFGILYVGAMVIQMTLGLYLWWVVHGFYHELQDKENEKRKNDRLVKATTNRTTSDV
ncbi:uncharacterized protein LOC116916545 isoform X1 [Daphnia magna]|nr:uncharacterized protein LOC116916545 isoform X1 [Daphnia magna]